MSYPNPPEISTSYTAQEQALGNGSLPGQELDVDLAAVRASITAIIEFLKTSIRSDGRLNNGSVSSDTLASSLIVGFDAPAPWATGAVYTTRSTVFSGFGFYLCLVAHTSGTFATDLASGRWVLLADLTPPGGALIASNNFSDVPDKPTARSTLGLGSMATANAGTGAADFRTNVQNDGRFQPLLADLSAFARTILDDPDAATVRATLAAQAADQDLTDIAAVARSRGMMLRGGASAWEGLALGSAGQVPTSDGTDLVNKQGPVFGRQTLATTSGATVDFSGIPAGINQFRLHLRGVSGTGTNFMSIRLGTSGGLVSTGYTGFAAGLNGAGVGYSLLGGGSFDIIQDTATQLATGTLVGERIEESGHVWALTYIGTRPPVAGSQSYAQVDLGAALTQLRIFWSGANSFDAGSATLAW